MLLDCEGQREKSEVKQEVALWMLVIDSGVLTSLCLLFFLPDLRYFTFVYVMSHQIIKTSVYSEILIIDRLGRLK